jgi:ligand-binding SRPBCC domain-containing protein
MFTDEVQHSKLLKWTHRHYLVKLGDTKTQVIDQLEFHFGYWAIGRFIEWIVLPEVERIFFFREHKIRELLEK